MNVLIWIGTALTWAGGIALLITWAYISGSWALLKTAAGVSMDASACIRVVTDKPKTDNPCRIIAHTGIGESVVISGYWLGVGRDKRAYVQVNGCSYPVGTTFDNDQDPGFLLTRTAEGWRLKCLGGLVKIDQDKSTYAQEVTFEPITEISDGLASTASGVALK